MGYLVGMVVDMAAVSRAQERMGVIVLVSFMWAFNALFAVGLVLLARSEWGSA